PPPPTLFPYTTLFRSKSTLFHLISGLLPSSSGSIWLKGQEITSLASHRISRLGLSRSFQITTIFPKMTVFENLRIGVMAKHHKRDRKSTRLNSSHVKI